MGRVADDTKGQLWMDSIAVGKAKFDSKAYARAQYVANREKRIAAAAAWAKSNREKRREISRRYYAKHHEKELERGRKRYRDPLVAKQVLERLKKWQRKARKERPYYLMKNRLRTRFGHILRKGLGKKTCGILDLVGCSYVDLKLHIENKFTDGMCWARMPEMEIDHIIPCAAFDLTDPIEQRKCFHFSNLQPLWKADNRRKGAR